MPRFKEYSLIVSKPIYPTLVDVFYGNDEFNKQEWVRVTFTKKKVWRITHWPKISERDELEYGRFKLLADMLPEINKHLEETYGKASRRTRA